MIVKPIVRTREKKELALLERGRPVEMLLVEDNSGDAILVEEALKEGRLVVNLTVLENGEDALKYLQKQGPYVNAVRPDMVILDLKLPRMGGHEVLEEIRKLEELKQIPVIVLTTSNIGYDIDRAYKSGATAFIVKPFGFYQFMEAIKNIENFWLSLVTLPS